MRRYLSAALLVALIAHCPLAAAATTSGDAEKEAEKLLLEIKSSATTIQIGSGPPCEKSISELVKKLLAQRVAFSNLWYKDGRNIEAIKYSITLSKPPSVRVRASVDSSTGKHQEVDWDPSHDLSLVRTVVLPVDKFEETWRVSFTADPLPISSTDSGANGLLIGEFCKGGLLKGSGCQTGTVFLPKRSHPIIRKNLSETMRILGDKVMACNQYHEDKKIPFGGMPVYDNLAYAIPAYGGCMLNLKNTAADLDLCQEAFQSVTNNLIKEPRSPALAWNKAMNSELEQFMGLLAGEGFVTQLQVKFRSLSPATSQAPADSSPLDFLIAVRSEDLAPVRDTIGRMVMQEGVGGHVRGLSSDAAGVATDVFQLLAEIAFERAKSKAFSILSQRLTDFVCDDLRLAYGLADELLSPAEVRPRATICAEKQTARTSCLKRELAQLDCQSHSGATVAKCAADPLKEIGAHPTCNPLRADIANQLSGLCLDKKQEEFLCYNEEANFKKMPVFLPQTCRAVQNLRIQELATSGKPILMALLGDLSSRLSNMLINQIVPPSTDVQDPSLQTVLQGFIRPMTSALDLATHHAIRNEPLAMRDVQLLFIDLSRALLSVSGSVLKIHEKYKETATAIYKTTQQMDKVQEQFNSRADALLNLRLPFEDVQMDSPDGGPSALQCLDVARGRHRLQGQVGLNAKNQRFEVFSFGTDGLKDFVCAAEMAFAVIAECSNSVGRCDARTLSSMLNEPFNYLHMERNCSDFILRVGIDRAWKDGRQFVTRGLDILQPPKGATPQQQLRVAIDLTFDLVERLYSEEILGGLLQDPGARNLRLFGQLLPELQRLTHGILDRDVQVALLAGVRLIELTSAFRLRSLHGNAEDPPEKLRQSNEKLTRVLRKVTQLVSAIGSYAQHYATDVADPKQAQAQREARKKALESLIEQTTERSNRQGDFIVSLGANVGFSAGGAYLVRPDAWQWSLPQLSLPMGVALQWLPRGTERGSRLPGDRVRGYVQFSLIDLAQFLAYDQSAKIAEVHWANFVTLGLQGGLLFGVTRKARPAELFNLGFNLQYAPSLGFPSDMDVSTSADSSHSEPQKGVLRFGVFLGYYVPFFDFN